MTLSLRMMGRSATAIGLAYCAALAAAGSAEAVTSCTFDSGTDILQVDMNASDDSAQVDVRTGEIRVFDEAADPSVQRTCSGGTPTVTETDTVFIIDGSDLPGGASLDGNTEITIAGPTDFAPGNDAEAGHPANIEFFLNPNNGTDDELFLFGTQGADNWEFGDSGLNWNAAADAASPDSEMVLSNPTLFDEILVNMTGGDDFVAALGGLATGGPLDGPEELSFLGGPDTDVVVGGNGDDFLGGEEGNDTMQGFAGNDTLRGFTGNDFYGGGAGSDTAAFTSSPVGVTVNLGQAGAQQTGEGSDTLIGTENLRGSNDNDTLIGTDAANTIEGTSGNDSIDGRGGDDTLFGGEPGFDDASDSVTYAQAPAAVSVDLTTGTATGGAGSDTLNGLEGLTGSPFADTLIGNAQANPITGLAGNDTVSALGGPDSVDVRDGEADTASCGSEIDSATADKASVDTVNEDCETISFLPEDPVDGGDDGNGTADTELSFDLSGKGKQRVLKQKGVVVRASCPLEACTATASGKGKLPKPKRAPRAKLNLKPVTEAVGAGVAEKIKLPLKRRALNQLKAVLKAGGKPKITVSASVTDAAGNAARDTLVIKAKR